TGGGVGTGGQNSSSRRTARGTGTGGRPGGEAGGPPVARGETPPAAPAPPPTDFRGAFDEAFAHLDRQGGGHNFVSLVALRAALPVARDRFDQELRRLRQEGRYRLSAAEGREGITPQEREAGITEEGSLLLFVSRDTP